MIKFLRFLLFVNFSLYTASSFAQFPFNETFKGTTAKGLVFGGLPKPAVLTAGTIDPADQGYLRLTSNGVGHTGFVYCNYVFPSTKGFSVDFEYFTHGYQWTPPGGDGISFFLFDASTKDFNIGAFGGALGYAQRYVVQENGSVIDLPGLSNGYLGIGLDEWGNYARNNEGKQGGLSYQSLHSVTIRGAGNGNALTPDNYPFLVSQRTEELSGHNFKINGGNRNATNSSINGYRKAIFELEPRTGGGYFITVKISYTEGGVNKVATVIDRYEYKTTAPTFLKFGFASSTGGTDNYHEIRNLNINLPSDANVPPPTAVNDNFTVNQGDLTGSVLHDILANDIKDNVGFVDKNSLDLNPSLPGVQKTFQAPGGMGEFRVNSEGMMSFIPANANVTGSFSASYLVNDLFSQSSNTATVTVTVNTKPVAADDAVPPFDQGTSITYNISTNDTDPNHDPTTDPTCNYCVDPATIDLDPLTPGVQQTISSAGIGAFAVNSSGVLTFVPVAEFYGPTSLKYTIKDKQGAISNEATISFNVTALNYIPVAKTFEITCEEDRDTVINVISFAKYGPGNNGVVEGTLFLASSTSNFEKSLTIEGAGTFSVDDAKGAIHFSPEPNFHGRVPSVIYRIKDKYEYLSAPASITVEVTPVNDRPVAVPDSYVILEDASPVALNITTNDADPDGQINKATIDLDPDTPAEDQTRTVAGGSFSANTDGTVTFTPSVNYSGTVGPIFYTVKDDKGALSNKGSITVTVDPVNDAPIAENKILNVNQGEPLNIVLPAYCFDAEGQLVLSSLTILKRPGFGTLSDPDASGMVTFSSSSSGTATFTYNIKDSDNEVSNTATITINVNKRPVLTNATFNVNSFAVGTYNLLASAVDDETPAGSLVTITTKPVNSSLFFYNPSTGDISYQSKFGYYGTDTLRYSLKDSFGAISNTATLIIYVNRIPVANNDSKRYNFNSPVDIDVLANDVDDKNNRDLIIGNVVFTQPANGVVSYNNNDGKLTYTPNQNFNGRDVFTYTITDTEKATSSPATVTLDLNNSPVAKDTTKRVNAGAPPTSFKLADLVDDKDGANSIDWSRVVFSPSIRIEYSPVTRTITYTQSATTGGTVQYNYTVFDNDGGSSTGKITISINSKPQVFPDLNFVINQGEKNKRWKVSEFASDDRGIDPSTLVAKTLPANCQVLVDKINGEFWISAPYDKFGNDSFTYSIKDNEGLESSISTISIRINRAPTAGNFTVRVREGETKTIYPAKFTEDLDGGLDTSEVFVKAKVNGISSLGNIKSAVLFTPSGINDGYFTYTVKDDNGLESNEGKVTVEVNARPRATDDIIVKRVQPRVPMEIDVLALNTANKDFDRNPGGYIEPGSLKIQKQGSKGQAVVSSGKVVYTPTPNAYGIDEFTYTVQDNEGFESNEAIVRVTINGAPIANDDLDSVEIKKTKNIKLSANDSDRDGIGKPDATKIDIIVQPRFGTLIKKADGSVDYTSTGIGDVTDTFTYTIKDYEGAVSNIATVSIVVHPPSKVGLAKKLSSTSKAVNGSQNVKFLFTLVNYGTEKLTQVSLFDDLKTAFAGAAVKVTKITTSPNLFANPSYDGKQDMNLLVKSASSIGPKSTETVELELNIMLPGEQGSFFNVAEVKATGRSGVQVSDWSTDGTKPDPDSPGDIEASARTIINLKKSYEFIPQGFSPNNDGTNDKLVIENTGTNRISIEIFNRWGNRVYKSANYQNDWEGKCTEGVRIGEDVPDGTYYYVVIIENTGKFVGYITVKR